MPEKTTNIINGIFIIFSLSGEPLGITQLKFAFKYKYMVEGSTFGLSLQLKCEILLLLIS